MVIWKQWKSKSFKFDFVLNANQDANIYQMKFGGLFDCAPTKVHGLGLLIYDDIKSTTVSFPFFQDFNESFALITYR